MASQRALEYDELVELVLSLLKRGRYFYCKSHKVAYRAEEVPLHYGSEVHEYECPRRDTLANCTIVSSV